MNAEKKSKFRIIAIGAIIVLASTLIYLVVNQQPSPGFSYFTISPTLDQKIDILEILNAYNHSHDHQYPEYIHTIAPPPGISISLAEYNQFANWVDSTSGGIRIYLIFQRMEADFLPSGLKEQSKYLESARLFLNGVEVDREMSRFKSGGIWGPAASVYSEETGERVAGSPGTDLSWRPQLFPGVYHARFEFKNSKGELFTYEWEFTITEDGG